MYCKCLYQTCTVNVRSGWMLPLVHFWEARQGSAIRLRTGSLSCESMVPNEWCHPQLNHGWEVFTTRRKGLVWLILNITRYHWHFGSPLPSARLAWGSKHNYYYNPLARDERKVCVARFQLYDTVNNPQRNYSLELSVRTKACKNQQV